MARRKWFGKGRLYEPLADRLTSRKLWIVVGFGIWGMTVGAYEMVGLIVSAFVVSVAAQETVTALKLTPPPPADFEAS